MIPRVNFKYIDHEPPRLTLEASNEHFAGSSSTYVSKENLLKLVADLENFPVSINSEATLQSGDLETSLGFFSLRFYCMDSMGHTALIVSLASEIAGNESKDERNVVTLKLQFEATALDTFRSELSSAIVTGKGEGCLNGIGKFTQNGYGDTSN